MSSSRFSQAVSSPSVALHLGNESHEVDRRHFQISPRGMVFRSSAALQTWTEVSVCLHLPNGNGGAREQVDCRGVVINCRRQRNGAWKCAVVFLDLSKKNEARLCKICPSPLETAVLSPFRNGSSRSPLALATV